MINDEGRDSSVAWSGAEGESPDGRPATRGASPWRGSNYLYVLPAMVMVLGIVYFAIGYTLRVSLLDWDGISPEQRSVGWANYSHVLRDPIFWSAIWHMTVYSLAILIQMALGLLFAILLHSNLKAKSFYKVLLFIPVVLAPAVMAPVFRQILDADGQLNGVLHAIGLDTLAHPWLADPGTALYALIAINVWQWTGFSFILYFAGLTQVDASLLEAARIDGAGNWRIVRSLLVPLTKGTSVTLLVLGVIGTVKTFDIPYLVTGGGPARSTEFLATYLYQQGITNFHAGYGAALTSVLMAVALLLAGWQIRRLRAGGEV